MLLNLLQKYAYWPDKISIKPHSKWCIPTQPPKMHVLPTQTKPSSIDVNSFPRQYGTPSPLPPTYQKSFVGRNVAICISKHFTIANKIMTPNPSLFLQKISGQVIFTWQSNIRWWKHVMYSYENKRLMSISNYFNIF